MLRPADRDLVARDAALPGLAHLLDAEALAGRLGRELAPTYLRYKVGTSCAVGLLGPDRTVEQAFAAFAYAPDRYDEVRSRAEWQGKAIYFDDICVAVAPARLDRGLRTLRRICAPDRRAKFLRGLLGDMSPVPADEPQVLRYKPGRRLVLRLAAAGVARAVLKTTGSGDFTRSLVGAATGAALGAAPLLAASAERHTHVTGWIAGRPLCPALAGTLPDPSSLAATGMALARLHSTPASPPFRVTRRQEMRALERIVADLGALAPELAERAAALLPRIAEALGRDAAPCFVHGDFSADQVILGDAGPVIIDFDAAATGDPASDIGIFAARLDVQALDGAIAAHAAEGAADALRTGYAATAGDVPAGAAAQHARALVMLVTEGFRTRHPDWPDRTAALLARAEAVLDRRRARRPIDPGLPPLADALDPEAVRAGLAAALGTAPEGLVLAAPRLLRHKPGSRAVVRYDVTLPDGSAQVLFGKLRAKGPDRRTPKVHAALRAAGLYGEGRRSVGVPRARGRIDGLHLWLQDLVPGRPLGSFLVPGRDPAPFGRVGAALAHLHRIPPVVDRQWTLADEADVLETALRRAAMVLCDAEQALAAITRGARARLEALGAGPVCGIHRDFYFDQVLVDGTRIWLVDLDLYAIGDPAIDLGNFLAHLDEFGLRRHDDPEAFGIEAATFLDCYSTVAALPDAERIATLREVSLARHVFLSTRFADRRNTTGRLLARATAALADPVPLRRNAR